jgi:hypothetical protein
MVRVTIWVPEALGVVAEECEHVPTTYHQFLCARPAVAADATSVLTFTVVGAADYQPAGADLVLVEVLPTTAIDEPLPDLELINEPGNRGLLGRLIGGG